jgi:hypothetical protein
MNSIFAVGRGLSGKVVEGTDRQITPTHQVSTLTKTNHPESYGHSINSLLLSRH